MPAPNREELAAHDPERTLAHFLSRISFASCFFFVFFVISLLSSPLVRWPGNCRSAKIRKINGEKKNRRTTHKDSGVLALESIALKALRRSVFFFCLCYFQMAFLFRNFLDESATSHSAERYRSAPGGGRRLSTLVIFVFQEKRHSNDARSERLKKKKRC